MSDNTTIARPYAKAIFQHALAKSQLSAWSALLSVLAQVVLHRKVKTFLTSPNASVADKVARLKNTLSGIQSIPTDAAVDHLLQILTEKKRILVLPEMLAQFEALRAEHEKTMVAHVRSYSALSQEQEARLKASLTKRLQREVSLIVTIDKTILGGAVIHAGDLVIDGSVRGKLNKLGTLLAA